MKRLRIFLASLGRRTLNIPHATPPLGILSLAAYLRTKFDVDIMLVDQRVENASLESIIRRAAQFEADVVGVSVITAFAALLGPLTQGISRALPDALIALGGPHVSSFQEAALAGNNAHAAVAGEGEYTLERIVQARLDGAGLADIPGLIWRNAAGEITTNPGVAPVVEDINTLPFPAYDLLDVRKYWRLPPFACMPPHRYVSLFSSRGCPYRCTYCHRVFGKSFRAQSAERLVDEVQHFQQAFGVSGIEFLDDIFNFDSKRVLEFSQLVSKRNLKLRINFPNALRADILSEEVIDALVGAGLYHSAFALESGSPRIQQFIGKRLNIDKFLRGVQLAADRRVFCNGFTMMGFPTETEEEMKATVDIVCESRLHTASFFTVIPYPNTDLYDYVAKTAPKKLEGLDYGAMEYAGSRTNLSDVPDEILFGYQRAGWNRFYMNPGRIARIVRDYPRPWFMPYYFPMYVIRATKGTFGNFGF